MLTRTFNTGKTEKAYIIPLGDTHIGEQNYNPEALKGYIKWILSHEHAYTFLMGDIFETVVKGNKPSDPWSMALSPKKALNEAEEVFQPLADAGRILGMMFGTHEKRQYWLQGAPTNIEVLAERLGYDLEEMVAFDGLLMQMQVGKVPYTIYCLHGWGGARRTGGQVNKTEEMAAVVKDADVYLIAHEHTMYASRWDSYQNGTTKKRQLFVGCGCFEEYTSFQEGIARRLPNVGAPRIRLNGERRDVHVSI